MNLESFVLTKQKERALVNSNNITNAVILYTKIRLLFKLFTTFFSIICINLELIDFQL